MTLKADQQQVKALLTETITLLCKNGLHFKSEFCVEGLIGVTLDREEVFLINIKETIRTTDEPAPDDATPDPVGGGGSDGDNNINDVQTKPDGDNHGNMSSSEQQQQQGKSQELDKLRGTETPSDVINLAHQRSSMSSLPPAHRYQRSRSTISFPQSFDDLLPHGSDDLRIGDDYDLSLLAHSACAYGQQERRLNSLKHLGLMDGRRKTMDDYPSSVFSSSSGTDDFSRQLSGSNESGHHHHHHMGGGTSSSDVMPSTSAGGTGQHKESHLGSERPAKRPRIEATEINLPGISGGVLHPVSSAGCSDAAIDQKLSSEILNIKQEPNLDGLSLAYSAMQAGHFDMDGGHGFPFSSSQRHFGAAHSSGLAPGCSLLDDGSVLDLQAQATRLAMFHLQLPTRRYSIAGKMFHCLACGKALSSLHNLKLHEATVHRGLFQYRCPLCGKGLRQERDLRGHLANRHNMKKDFRCSICGNEFGYKRNLKQHMVSYHGWKDVVVQLPL